uniref:C-type lectin domain-containing protein n=1 Tax=Cyclopterus lumpus TaxID=8103 RepID=A0A8C2Z1Q1_CYCLU
MFVLMAPTDQRFLFFSQTLPPIAVCWLILVLILGLRIHFTNVLSVNEAKLTAEIQQLKTLTRRLNASEDVSTPPAAIRNRTDRSAGDQEPETNVSRAQWSVDAYCPGSNGRRCQPCQRGWHFFQSGCYAMLYPDPPGWKTWEEAREDCRGKNSDLVSMDNAAEKGDGKTTTGARKKKKNMNFLQGHWIGLRVEDGRWKWVDGSDLNQTSWIVAPADGHCAASVTAARWRSVSCGDRNRWSCKKKALFV